MATTAICTCDTIIHNDETTICTTKPTTPPSQLPTLAAGGTLTSGVAKKMSGEDNHYPPRLAVFQSITGMTGN